MSSTPTSATHSLGHILDLPLLHISVSDIPPCHHYFLSFQFIPHAFISLLQLNSSHEPFVTNALPSLLLSGFCHTQLFTNFTPRSTQLKGLGKNSQVDLSLNSLPENLSESFMLLAISPGPFTCPPFFLAMLHGLQDWSPNHWTAREFPTCPRF